MLAAFTKNSVNQNRSHRISSCKLLLELYGFLLFCLLHSRNLCYLQSYYSIVSMLRSLVIRCKIVICLNCKLLSGVFRRGFVIYQIQQN